MNSRIPKRGNAYDNCINSDEVRIQFESNVREILNRAIANVWVEFADAEQRTWDRAFEAGREAEAYARDGYRRADGSSPQDGDVLRIQDGRTVYVAGPVIMQ